MKKIILSLVFGICFIGIVSCQSPQERLLNKLAKVQKNNLIDCAFKNNTTIEFIEYVPLKVDTITQNNIDSLKLYYVYNDYKYFLELYKNKCELVKSTSNLYILYAEMFGKNDNITRMKHEDYEKELKEAKEYEDSLNYYTKQDSILRAKIKNNKNPEQFYQFKYFMKAVTTNKDQSTENTCDTLYQIINKNFEVVNIFD